MYVCARCLRCVCICLSVCLCPRQDEQVLPDRHVWQRAEPGRDSELREDAQPAGAQPYPTLPSVTMQYTVHCISITICCIADPLLRRQGPCAVEGVQGQGTTPPVCDDFDVCMYVCMCAGVHQPLLERGAVHDHRGGNPPTYIHTYIHTYIPSPPPSSMVPIPIPIPISLPLSLCVCVSQAIAMGKWVVCADHPSNLFFKQFPNCLMFRNEGLASSCMHAYSYVCMYVCMYDQCTYYQTNRYKLFLLNTDDIKYTIKTLSSCMYV